jgi:hypothetical protein
LNEYLLNISAGEVISSLSLKNLKPHVEHFIMQGIGKLSPYLKAIFDHSIQKKPLQWVN